MKLKSTIALAAALATAAAGVGYAAIPSSSGVVSACKKADGSIKLIDKESGQACSSSQTLVEWSKQGPVGPQGPAGPADPGTGEFVDRFGTDTGHAAAANGAPCTLGQVLLTASHSSTAGGLPANGQLLPVDGNEALFVVLGATYGGDGEATFALPDLRAIAPDHMTYSICTGGVYPTP